MSDRSRQIDIREFNRAAWSAQVRMGNRWTIPVTSETIHAAHDGNWQVVLTPTKPVPKTWFPDFTTRRTRVLCLASGGGQQGPILAAAGAIVTVLDYCEAQLDQDRMVAARDGLAIETVCGDMSDLTMFDDATFDLVFHPCSNLFVENVLPVWREASRVLKPGCDLLSGFVNPVHFIFDEQSMRGGLLKVAHSIPYSEPNLRAVSQTKCDRDDPLCFGHSLTDQIAGQIAAGFAITGFYEDRYDDDDLISQYIDSFVATKSTKI
jgi:SAM-dependent methyltransferase